MTSIQEHLSDHLSGLLRKPSSSASTLDHDLATIQLLQTALNSFSFSDLPHLIESRATTGNVWQRLQQRVQDDKPSHQDHLHAVTVDTPQASPSSAVAQLEKYLQIMSQTDPAMASSVTDIFITTLGSPKSDEQISIEIAEVLGFDYLDLVTAMVADRDTVYHALKVKSLLEIPQPHAASQSGTILLPDSATFSSAQPSRASFKPYTPRSQVVVQTQEEKEQATKVKNELRKAQKARPMESHATKAYTVQELEQIREHSLAQATNRPLFSSTTPTSASEPQYPHVFSSGAHGNILSAFGQKFALPLGTTREEKEFFEEVIIPPPKTVPIRTNERFVPISEMDALCRGAFSGYKTLNRLQSAVYPLAYQTNENLLVCAPTGAGKTDVAMLTVLRTISQYAHNIDPVAGRGAVGFGIATNHFKIVYVAPMKALASEIVRKFSRRLQCLGIKVKELTGDMQLTRKEIAETQIIVTTPEKWDVVTRKPTGDGELASKVRLLIIDEVHLLHDDRGSVIETIVARTLRLVESSQSLIRIVGLSATLPNYIDVADFLRVNRYQGLFYFDSSFRPVPLEQHFIGVKGKAGTHQSRANLDKVAYEKVSELVEAGHQVMVFVHTRKDTVKTSQTLQEMFKEEGLGELLVEFSKDNPRRSFFKKELQSSRNREMRELFETGFGIHHAGMLRSDRNLSERMFEAGVTRVLCCTATLAWGVNLPAFAVVIKGTDVYDSAAGKTIDLSILDVLQIFGRAGRPQYEDLGVGYICTSQDRLSHYVDAITSQHPIESKFIGGLIDSLNAEIALGTVSSVGDAISWLGYTYLYTRMRRTPLTYGINYAELEEDPHLGAKRLQLITSAAKTLQDTKMIVYDPISGHLQASELGRIAAKYYIGYRTVEIFNEKLRANQSEADVLGLLSLATDFEQISPRDTEEKELKKMLENAPCEVPGGIETSPGKVNVLLQAYISKTFVEDFALVSDSNYVAQNAARIVRSLLEIALSRRWAPTTAALISMSKAIEKRMWPFDHPLSQSNLTPDTLYNLVRWADEVQLSELTETSANEIGKLVHLNEKMGGAIRQAARTFPKLTAKADLRPLTHDLVRVDVHLERAFEWSERLHGKSQPFYVWIEDDNGIDILQWVRQTIRPTELFRSVVSFTIPISDPIPSGVNLRWTSDTWLGCEDTVWISFGQLVMPSKPKANDPLMDLPLLNISTCIRDDLVQSLYAQHVSALNAIQTQCFHTVMHTRANTLLCAPSSSGKTTIAHMSAWRELANNANNTILLLYPRYELLDAAMDSLFVKVAKQSGIQVGRTGSSSSLERLLSKTDGTRICLTTPMALIRAQRSSKDDKLLDTVSLVIAEDLHLLTSTYELGLSTLLWKASASSKRIKIVATSITLDDPSSVSEWLGVKETTVYNFHSKDRPSPLTTSFQTFDLPHSAGLLKTMVKPTYDRLKEHISNGPAILFTPSRGQCFSVAADLVTKCAAEMDTEAFIGIPLQDLEATIAHVQDSSLYEPLMHGIGIFYDGMLASDQALGLQLFEQGIIKVMVAPRECCWSLPLRAHLVVILSTQYVQLTKTQGPTGTSERQIVDYSLDELSKMQSLAVRPSNANVTNAAGECLILCQSERASLLEKMLHSGMPVHSMLLDHGASSLVPFLLHEIVTGRVETRQDAIQMLSWTLLPAELGRNPTFYDAFDESHEASSVRLSECIDSLVDQLEGMRAINIVFDTENADEEVIEPTNLGRALELQAPSTVIHVAKWHTTHSGKPFKAGLLFHNYSSPNANRLISTAEDSAENEVLKATRSVLGSDWLTAFQLVRGKVEKEGEPGAMSLKVGAENAVEERAKAIDHRTKVAILLAAYFAKLPLVTSSEALLRRTKKKDRPVPSSDVKPDDQTNADVASQKLAIEKLETEMAAEVLALLESISSVKGTAKAKYAH